jgi:hypothetical protein
VAVVLGSVVAWSCELGEYSMVCSFEEKPSGTCTVRVVENGEQLDRRVFVDDPGMENAWEKAWTWAMSLRPTFEPRALAAMRPIYLRLRSL